jgi:hypothetical protein
MYTYCMTSESSISHAPARASMAYTGGSDSGTAARTVRNSDARALPLSAAAAAAMTTSAGATPSLPLSLRRFFGAGGLDDDATRVSAGAAGVLRFRGLGVGVVGSSAIAADGGEEEEEERAGNFGRHTRVRALSTCPAHHRVTPAASLLRREPACFWLASYGMRYVYGIMKD